MLLIGGGAAATALIASLTFLALKGVSNWTEGEKSLSAQATTSAPAALPAPPPPPRPTVESSRDVLAPGIDNEKTDRRPLALSEVFPTDRITVDGRLYKLDKTSVNHRCELAARGAMATTLVREECRKVVRATFVHGKQYAVTTGVAVMPTRAAAITAKQAGDPDRYEWFRGMRGKVATEIDQPGGSAFSMVRGRYVIYAYALHVDGSPSSAEDPALESATRKFVAYAVRPIDQRTP